MKKLLIVSFSNIQSDPRVRRQIEFYKKDFDITIIGFGALSLSDITMLSVKNKTGKFNFLLQISKAFLYNKILGNYKKYYNSVPYIIEAKKILDQVQKQSFDLIISNDIYSLPVLLEYFDGNRILFDAHEYSPLEFSENLLWRLCYQKYNGFLCKEFILKAKYFTTVCEGLSKLYASFLNCDLPKVITNAPSYSANHSVKELMPDSQIRLIHHGAAISSRKIELMIDMMDYLPSNYSLDLMLTNTAGRYYNKLLKHAENNDRIRFIPPVNYENIVSTLNESYDIGVYILPPSNMNSLYALPNKFFEFVQARLCIAIGPSPEMKNLVEKYSLGVVAEDFSASQMAMAIKSISIQDINTIKNNVNTAASILCAEKNKEILFDYIES